MTNYPKKVLALLESFGLDDDEYVVYKESQNIWVVNDIRYMIFDQNDLDNETCNYRDSVKEDLLDDIPDFIEPYIDWDKYFNCENVNLYSYYPSMEEMIYKDETFYKIEL